MGAGESPVVAWNDSGSVFVRRWKDATWEELDGSATLDGIGQTYWGTMGEGIKPDVAVDPDDRVLVAWVDETTGQLLVHRFDGIEWEEIGGPGAPIETPESDRLFSPQLAVDEHGRAVVAWSDTNWNIYLRRLEEGSWEQLGGSAEGSGVSGGDGVSRYPSLVLTPEGLPVLAWYEDGRLYLKQWTGSEWREVAGSASGDGLGANTGTFSLDFPFVYGTRFRFEMGPSVDVDEGGRIFVAWEDDGSGWREIRVAGYNGREWVTQELEGGVSNSPAASTGPALSVANGEVCVAWHEPHPGGVHVSEEATQIVLRCALTTGID